MKRETVQLRASIKAMVPMTPNFIRDVGGTPYPINQFSAAELRQIAKAWTDELLRKAGHKA